MGDKVDMHTLITGASRGIGKAFAMECARRKMNLVLVSLPGEELPDLAHSIRTEFGIGVHALEIDLLEADASEHIMEFCRKRDLHINVLINNAGIGCLGPFLDADPDRLRKLVELNCASLTSLTHIMLPELSESKPSYILNMASFGGFMPVPYKGIYSASKAFVISLSRALSRELKGQGISVTIVAPAAVPTNSNTTKAVNNLGFVARFGAVSAEQVARRSIRRMLKGKALAIPGIINRIAHFLTGFATPGFMAWLGENLFRDQAGGKVRY